MITNVQLGSNLSIMRRLRGFSQRDLADKLTESTGIFVSGQTISAWQNGKRPMLATTLFAIADVLKCTPHQLYYKGMGPDDAQTRMMDEIQKLPNRDKQILTYLMCEWEGNEHLLCEFAMLYASLPPLIREDIAFYGIHLYMKHQHAASCKVNIQALLSGWKRLTKGDS